MVPCRAGLCIRLARAAHGREEVPGRFTLDQGLRSCWRDRFRCLDPPACRRLDRSLILVIRAARTRRLRAHWRLSSGGQQPLRRSAGFQVPAHCHRCAVAPRQLTLLVRLPDTQRHRSDEPHQEHVRMISPSEAPRNPSIRPRRDKGKSLPSRWLTGTTYRADFCGQTVGNLSRSPGLPRLLSPASWARPGDRHCVRVLLSQPLRAR
jgi:hypothetical protein